MTTRNALTLGEVTLVALPDGARTIPLQPRFVPNVPLDEVAARLAAAGRAPDGVEIPFTPTLVRTGGRTILIDTGNGPQAPGAPVGHRVEKLAAEGLAPGDIDTVVISHFHGVHSAGLRDAAGAPAFPNATVLVPASEVAYWRDPAEAARALEGRRAAFASVERIFGPGDFTVETYGDGDTLAPGLVARAAPGHAPGHTAFEIGTGETPLLHLGDAVHLPAVFLARPDWAIGFDMDADAARATRRRLLEEAIARDLPVAGYHWGRVPWGRLARDGDGYRLGPL